jgi:hypothetical protein
MSATKLLVGGAVIGGGFLAFRWFKQRAVNLIISQALGEGAGKAVNVIVTQTGDLLVGGLDLVKATGAQIARAAEFIGIDVNSFLITAPEGVTDPEALERAERELSELGITRAVDLSVSPIEEGVDFIEAPALV